MAPTYSLTTDPTPAQLTAFMAVFPPIAGAEGTPGAPAAAAEGGGGQGEGSAGGGSELYAQHLERVPAELREQVAPILKEWDGNVTKKMQEAAEFRSGWEPYEQLGVRDVEPETMEQVLNWLQMTNDEDAYKSWVQQQAEGLGLLSGAAGGEGFDPEATIESLDELDPSQVMTREQFQQELQKFKAESQAEQQLTVAQQAKERELNERFEALSKEVGLTELEGKARETHENAIWSIAQARYAGDKDPVGKAFADYKGIVGSTETDLLRKKLAAPSPPEGGGGAPDTAVARPRTMKEAGELLRGRLQQAAT